MIMDDRNLMGKIDKSNMLELIENFDAQCIEANNIAVKKLPAKNYDCIVCAGMGGSAIAGDILKQLVEINSSIPFIVHRNYGLPAFITEKSLVLAVSYSGDTEETLSAFKEAIRRGSTVVSLSSGGKLEKISKMEGMIHIKIPAGQPPRCSLGYIFFPLAKLLEKSGYIEKVDAVKIGKTAEQLKAVYGINSEENRAKNFARTMHGKNIIIYSGELLSPAATRWKTQFAENSKHMAFLNLFPEMNHNEIMAWNFPAHFIEKCLVFFLRDRDDNDRVKLRMDLTKDILRSKKISVYDIESEGKKPVERIFSLVMLGDWISFYLALLNGVDPTEIREITDLKKKLA